MKKIKRYDNSNLNQVPNIYASLSFFDCDMKKYIFIQFKPFSLNWDNKNFEGIYNTILGHRDSSLIWDKLHFN